MTIQLIVDNVEVPIKVIKFSDGGSNIKLEVPEQLVKYPPSAYYSISVDQTTPVDNYLWEILLTLDAITETFGGDWDKTILKLPYLPHGRADRVFEKGNGIPQGMFLCSVLKYFDEVFLTDPHSEYHRQFYSCPDEVFIVKQQHQCFVEVAGKDIQSGDIIVSPDKGALNKIYKLQQALDYRMVATSVVEAGKKRDVETGKVIETTLPDVDIKGKVVWIVDDICDGAGSFIPLARKLKEKGAKEVNMYVTHLIAAKGLGNLFGLVDKLYAYQVIGNYINMEDVRKFNNGIEPRKFY